MLNRRTPALAALMLTAALFALHGADAFSQSTTLSALEHRATLLQDANDIKRLQRIYGYYLDRSDWENVVDLLTDDATAEYGGSGVYVGKSSVRKLLYAIGYDRAGLPPGLLREHMQFQPVVDVAPDGLTAKGRWRVFAILGQQGHPGEEYARWQAGPYENEYRKEGGIWKISKIRWYETFTVPFEGGWKTQLVRANLGDRRMPPQDRPSTSKDEPWPKTSLPPYHYTAAEVGRPCCEAPLHDGTGTDAIARAAKADETPPATTAKSSEKERLASLRLRVQRLEDERDIEKLQRTYGYFVDKNLWRQASELFADDGTLEIGGRGVFVGKERVLQYLKWLGHPVDGRLYDHTQLQPVITIAPDGRTAQGRWRALIFTGGLDRDSVLGDAIYENEYRKEGDHWKIAKLHAYFILYTTLERGGWDKFTLPNTHPEKDLPPDRPPTVVYEAYPGTLSAPCHFANPVTGPHREPVSSAARTSSSRTSVTALSRRIMTIADTQAIENLQNAYGYFIDKWQWDDAASLFADDATYEAGLRGVYVGQERIRAAFDLMGTQGLHPGAVNDRIQYQPIIDVAADGMRAKARVRQMDILGDYGKQASIGSGVQENEYVKVNGVWKIRSLHLYTTFLADLEKGWAHGAQPAPALGTALPPDRGPTEKYAAFPQFYVPAFHFRHPVTGKPIEKE